VFRTGTKAPHRFSSWISLTEFEENNFVSQLRKKLNELHEGVRQQLELRSRKVKDLYDKKDRRLLFEAGQKVWL